MWEWGAKGEGDSAIQECPCCHASQVCCVSHGHSRSGGRHAVRAGLGGGHAQARETAAAARRAMPRSPPARMATARLQRERLVALKLDQQHWRLVVLGHGLGLAGRGVAGKRGEPSRGRQKATGAPTRKERRRSARMLGQSECACSAQLLVQPPAGAPRPHLAPTWWYSRPDASEPFKSAMDLRSQQMSGDKT